MGIPAGHIRGSGNTAPLILNLSTTCMSAIRFTPQYPLNSGLSFIHFIFHISIYRYENTKDVEIVIVVVIISVKVTNVKSFNTITL
jgi:hypothetical protein